MTTFNDCDSSKNWSLKLKKKLYQIKKNIGK